jgi:hypothetical protein
MAQCLHGSSLASDRQTQCHCGRRPAHVCFNGGPSCTTCDGAISGPTDVIDRSNDQGCNCGALFD